MRAWFLLFALCFLAMPVMSQEYKYKDLVLLLQNASPHEQIAMLWDHLTHEPGQVNADFRLAKLHYDLFRQADPIIEYESAMAHAHEASERLFRAKIVITESEVRRNNEYYSPFFKDVDSRGRPYVEFPVVQQKMQVAYDSVMQFKSTMPAIYKAFTRSVNQYGTAVRIFSKINDQYRTFEDILLLFDKNMEAEFKMIKTAYDSSVHYFDQYIALTREYPLNNYNQRYAVKPIVVYHLDGLTTGLNFLSPQVDLWNYSAWVDDFYKVYNQEIVPLRNKLDQNENIIARNLADLTSSTTPLGEFHQVEKDLVFNLNKFDKNSLALGLLRYKAFKQQWISRSKLIGSDTTIERKLNLYSSLIHQNRKADSLHSAIANLINPLSLQKHRDFLSKNYSGEQGLGKFVADERALVTSSFTQYRDTLRENLIAYLDLNEPGNRTLKLGSFNIPLVTEVRPVSELDVSAPVTLRRTRNPDGSFYLAGIHKMNKKVQNVMVFVARMNPDGKTGWVKEYNLPPDSLSVAFTNRLGDIVATQEGCAAIITSVDTVSGRIANTFVFINEQGKETIHKVTEQKMARQLLYQERSNSFIMLFKGDEEDQNYQREEVLSLVSINILGDLLWRRDISLSGTLQDVVPVRDGYVLVGNYTSIKNTSGREFKTKVALRQANPYLMKLGLGGNVVNILPVTTDKSICVGSVIKVNDESINLLGYETTFDQLAALPPGGNAFHMMADYTLKKICSDF